MKLKKAKIQIDFYDDIYDNAEKGINILRQKMEHDFDILKKAQVVDIGNNKIWTNSKNVLVLMIDWKEDAVLGLEIGQFAKAMVVKEFDYIHTNINFSNEDVVISKKVVFVRFEWEEETPEERKERSEARKKEIAENIKKIKDDPNLQD